MKRTHTNKIDTNNKQVELEIKETKETKNKADNNNNDNKQIQFTNNSDTSVNNNKNPIDILKNNSSDKNNAFQQQNMLTHHDDHHDKTYLYLLQKSITLSIPILFNCLIYFSLISIVYYFSNRSDQRITESISFINIYYNLVLISILDGWIIPFEIEASSLYAKKNFKKLVNAFQILVIFTAFNSLVIIILNYFFINKIIELLISDVETQEEFLRFFNILINSVFFFSQYLILYRLSNVIHKNFISLLANLFALLSQFYFSSFFISKLGLGNTGAGLSYCCTNFVYFLTMFIYYILFKNNYFQKLAFANLRSSTSMMFNSIFYNNSQLNLEEKELQDAIPSRLFDFSNLDLSYFLYYINYGFPIFLQYILAWFGVEAIGFIALYSGAEDFTMFSIFTSYSNVLKVMGLAIGNTSYVLTRFYLGKNDEKSIWKLFVITTCILMLLNTVTCGFSYIYRNEILHIYTNNSYLIFIGDKSFVLLILMITTQSLSTAVRLFLVALGWVNQVLIVVIIGPFFIQCGLSFILMEYYKMGLYGICLGVVIGQSLMFVVFCLFVYLIYRDYNIKRSNSLINNSE